MTWRAWLAGVLAILVLCTAQDEENSDRVTGRANGLTIRFAVQAAATAEGWAGFHKPTDADTVKHPTRPDLNRHLVVELVDEKSGRPVTDATVEVIMTPRNEKMIKRHLWETLILNIGDEITDQQKYNDSLDLLGSMIMALTKSYKDKGLGEGDHTKH